MSGTMNEREHLVIYEKTPTGYSAYIPDLPGCITTGPTLPETKKSIAGSNRGDPSVMREFGDAIPQPTTVAERMQVPA